MNKSSLHFNVISPRQWASISTWSQLDSDQAKVVQSKTQLWSHMLPTIQACPQRQSAIFVTVFLIRESNQCQWGTHANLHINARGILFRPEISNLNEMVSNSKVLSSIKCTKARSTESPDILKNPQRTVWVLKNSLSVGKQSIDITWTHPTTNPHSCNVKLKWPGATTQANDACCCCWSCPELLQCDWHMYVQQLKTASQQMSACHFAPTLLCTADTLAHCWTTLQPWSLYRSCMQSAQKPNEACRPCCQHADLRGSKQVGHKGSLPSWAAKKDWNWTKRGSCWGGQGPCYLCPAIHKLHCLTNDITERKHERRSW